MTDHQDAASLLYAHTIPLEVAKATPPALVTVSGLFGVPWDVVVYIMTAIYIALQIFFILRDKWWRDKGKADTNGSE